MRGALFIFVLSWLSTTLSAQYVYTIKADSVKLTNCDSSELIIENHTQDVPGFLFNTGNGRTVFKRGVVKINDSLFLIGGDSLKYNAWVQGGNKFGAAGVLGTLDTNNLDLYTNKVQRARLTKNGNLLVGTTTDNGNKFQVIGASSFSGNVGIGTATITNTGNLIGTNALLFNYFIPKFHNYRSNSDPFIGRLENLLYNYSIRFKTTTDTSGGVYTIDMVIPANEITPGIAGLVYPQGYMCFSFWNGGSPQSVSIMMKDSLTGTWFGPYSSSTNIGYSGAGFFQVGIPGSFNWLTEIKIVITPLPGLPVANINLQDMEYVANNGGGGFLNPFPYVSKEALEHLYYPLFFRSAGVDNVMISPYGSSYFLGNLTLGSTADNGSGAKLQITGNMSSTGNFTCAGSIGVGTTSPSTQLHTTGGVRFAGLTRDTTKTRVIVSDANGNLFYRDASTLAGINLTNSSLATGDTLHSSLAVNGTISAQKLKLSQTDWPDYVFDSSYRLPSLKELERYIQKNKHLPGMPSAGEVGNKGIDVGDHQAALLKEIEELTLYNIAQDKELKVLKQEMTELRKMIENSSCK